MIGQRFGRLVVLAEAGRTRQGKPRYLAHCDCGVTCEVIGAKLRSGWTRSCGCLRRETAAAQALSMSVHGHAGLKKSRTYKSWTSMWGRCTRPTNIGWKHYGGRGITVCERWRTFENFLADMGERPADRTLDRIDPDGNYEPGNCRWATASEQRRNRRQLPGATSSRSAA